MKAVALGDLYQSDGRSRTAWSVDGIIDVPKSGTMVRLAKIDGYGSATVHSRKGGLALPVPLISQGRPKPFSRINRHKGQAPLRAVSSASSDGPAPWASGTRKWRSRS
jgi:hypothetical protein